MNAQTLENLETAMRGEAFAYARYTLFAQAARANGRSDLAELFDRIAHDELTEHFAEEAALAGLVGTDEENLSAAIAGERYEVETMYRGFARAAAAAGDLGAARRFEEVRSDEMGHRAAFEAALANLAGVSI